jgi:hypothetical protein
MKIPVFASVAGVLLLLSGCSSAPDLGPGPLADVVEQAEFSSKATDACRSISPDGLGPMVASFDSTAGSVRELATSVTTRAGWDKLLPPSADTYVAVCIYDVSETLNQKAQYAASWVGFEDSNGGMGLITLW